MPSIFEGVVEKVMASCGRGVCLRLTGSKYGLSYHEWEKLIRNQLRERKFRTPRCQRLRAWDPEVRLVQLKALEH